jgi:hypothetical protein
MTGFAAGSAMNSCHYLRCSAANPEAVLDRTLAEFAAGATGESLLAVDFSFCSYWQEGQPREPLVALYHLRRAPAAVRIDAAVLPGGGDFDSRWQARGAAAGAWLDTLDVARFDLAQPLPLAPVAIPKPWGRELWYTGIERRGVAAVCRDGRSAPLPWLLAIAPRRLGLAAGDNPILLKILDPLPSAVYGDLYFELHRQKQEVYIVTAVDRAAWPDGVGAIRFGFDAGLRRQYADDRRFLQDYLGAVRAYRAVRRDIDALLDARRAAERIGLNEPVDAATLQRWLADVPAPLQRREQQLREAMDRFAGLLPLRVGDVLKVPCWVPHSLQHGVRTVEFQTPVYERLILSFAQKVLTQEDWDTEQAAPLLQLDPPPPPPLQITAAGEGWREERIVEFDDFEVRRLTVQAGAQRRLPPPRHYALAMVIGGALHLQGAALAPDSALLLPGSWEGGLVENRGRDPHMLLLAYPRAD